MSKRWKRLTVSIAALSLLVGSIAMAQTQITYWLWLDDATDPVWPELVDEFHAEHPDIIVDYELIPLAQFYDRLLTAASSDSAPDAARFKEWWLGDFVENELLVDLDGYIADWPGASDVIDNLYNTGRTRAGGPVYMLPHQYITFYMYYRADRLAELGVDPPTTMEEFIVVAQQLTDPSQQRYGFALRGGAGGQDQWLAFMLAGGCNLVDEAGEVVADGGACVAANQAYIDLFGVHEIAPPSAPSDGFAQVIGSFEAGITSFVAHHVGSSKRLTDVHGDALGVMDIPAVDPANPATMAAMSGNVIFAGSDKEEAAWTFLSWLTEQEQMDKMSRSINGQLPVLQSVAELDYYQQNPFFRLSLAQADYATAWPPLPGVGYISSQLWQASMQRALLGEISSEEMMREIAAALRGEY
ncbi:MAG: sugar ABC transporter substrate-binding protein [Trueperaceae bacterium]